MGQAPSTGSASSTTSGPASPATAAWSRSLDLTPCFGDFDVGSCLPPPDPTYCVPAMGYESYMPGLYDVLKGLGDRYPDLPWWSARAASRPRSGARRAEIVVRALEQIDRARNDGVDVRGYYHWSLYDNFEWAEGYAPALRPVPVDRTDVTPAPRPKARPCSARSRARGS